MNVNFMGKWKRMNQNAKKKKTKTKKSKKKRMKKMKSGKRRDEINSVYFASGRATFACISCRLLPKHSIH